MRAALSRLRWQLTLSHLVAIAVTLVSMIAAVLLISSAFWSQATSPAWQPAEDARAIAQASQGLVARAQSDGATSLPASELNAVLGMLGRGDLRLASGFGFVPPPARARAPMNEGITNLAYIVVVGPNGQVLGSSDPSGAAFAPAERDDWTPLAGRALAGVMEPSRLVSTRQGPGPAALGASPVIDANGHVIAAALVAKTTLPGGARTWDFWQALLFFAAASLTILLAASVFALASSTLVSYVLSRRLVRRLERLGAATESFASGDLSRRVDSGPHDEVGQLASRFNAMADRLSATLAELATEKRAVEEALQAKRALVANVSHELRTPLASIRGHAESLLLRRASDPETQRYVEVIHRQAEQLSGLVDDLFVLSTTDAGALPLATQPVNLAHVIDEVVTSIQAAARTERQVQVLSEVDRDLQPVLADRQRLAQVLANLVRNAVRHTPRGGLVAVRAAPRDSAFAVIIVEDTGEGIPAEDLERIFERFQRVESARDRGSGGAGLGLAIVRELVTAMGGEVTAESVIGRGSRFWFTLPLAAATDVVDAEQRLPQSASLTGR